MMLHELLDRAASASPDSPAVIFEETTITFGQMSERVRQMGAVLDSFTQPGDRVAMVGENHPAWIEAYYGIPRAGRILLFLNHRLAEPELVSILERAGANLVVGAEAALDGLRSPDGRPPRVPMIGLGEWSALIGRAEASDAPTDRGTDPDGGARREGRARPDRQAGPDGRGDEEAAWLIYTSGTTGSPKGAVLTHANLMAALGATAAGRPVGPEDVYLFPFPLCHVAGYNVLHHHARGRPVVLLARFEPRSFIRAAIRHRVTTTSLAATMLVDLLDELEVDSASRRALGATLRSIAYGAAPMPPAVLRRAARLLDVDFQQGYGMTELSGNAVFLGPLEHRLGLADRPLLLSAAGRPGPAVELRISDDDDREVDPGATGEILVRGPQVASRYWEEPDATRQAWRGGWFHTGDVGRVDAEGYLYVMDRKKDVIVTGGENVASREVEDAIHGFGGISQAAVIGVPDPRWGENVCAVVTPQAGATIDPAALVSHVRGLLAGFKIPRHVVVVDQLPKNVSGKILKSELRNWLSGHPEELGPRL